MKNVLVVVLLLLAGSISSGFISKATSSYSGKLFIEESAPDTTMVFPVAGKRSIIGSFWGAARDGGKRKHEGVEWIRSLG